MDLRDPLVWDARYKATKYVASLVKECGAIASLFEPQEPSGRYYIREPQHSTAVSILTHIRTPEPQWDRIHAQESSSLQLSEQIPSDVLEEWLQALSEPRTPEDAGCAGVAVDRSRELESVGTTSGSPSIIMLEQAMHSWSVAKPTRGNQLGTGAVRDTEAERSHHLDNLRLVMAQNNAMQTVESLVSASHCKRHDVVELPAVSSRNSSGNNTEKAMQRPQSVKQQRVLGDSGHHQASQRRPSGHSVKQGIRKQADTKQAGRWDVRRTRVSISSSSESSVTTASDFDGSLEKRRTLASLASRASAAESLQGRSGRSSIRCSRLSQVQCHRKQSGFHKWIKSGGAESYGGRQNEATVQPVIREEKTALGDDIKALFQDRPTSPSPDSSEVQIVRGWQLRQRAQELQMPLDDIKFLKEVFDSFDIDGSGTLEFEEFEATVRRLLELTGLPTDNARAMSEWSYWDSGCSQGIDFDEFLKWYSSNSFKEDFLLTRDQQELRRIAKKYKVSPDYVEEMKKHFDLCTNYAEEASLDEFRPALLKALKVPAGCKMPESRIRFFWSQLDADSSGQVNFSEFFDWWMLYFGEQEGAEQLPFERFYGQVRRLGKDFLDPPPVAEPPVAEPPVAALLPTSTDNGNVDRTGEDRQGNHSIIGDTE